MQLNINIANAKVQNFSPDAINELTEQTKRMSEEIADEAARIETSRRLAQTNSEVTQSIVREAATQPRMFTARKKSNWIKLLQVISLISTSIAGYLFDVEKFTDLAILACFLLASFIGLGTAVYLIFINESNG